MGYPGLFNSSYHPSPLEAFYISTPQNQVGPVIIGEILVALLQGVLLVQYYDYICNFWHEKRWTKWLVHLAFVLCLFKFAYVWWLTWDRFVPHYGDWAYLAIFSPIAVPIGISTTIPSAVCQVFYISRCWALSRNWLFLIPAVTSLLLTVGSGIALTWGSALAAGGDVSVTKLILISINTSLTSGLICDVFITTFTCFYLIREKTGFKQTDGLVSRLVKCSIESAVGPTVVALITLVLSNKATDNQWFLVPSLSLSHVYGCSLFYTVNARKTVGLRTPVTTSKPQTSGFTGQLTAGNTHIRHSFRNNDFPLQDLSRGSRPGILVEVQTVMNPDNSMHNQVLTRTDGKRKSQDDDSYVLAHSKSQYDAS